MRVILSVYPLNCPLKYVNIPSSSASSIFKLQSIDKQFKNRINYHRFEEKEGSIYYIKMITRAQILWWVIMTIVSAYRLEINKFTQEKIRQNWKKVQQQAARTQQLIINFSGLTQGTLNKLLSLPMPKLKVLSFNNHRFDATQPSFQGNYHHPQYLTHKLVKTIFNNPYLMQLQELNLIGTNIDDNFFNFSHESREKPRKLRLKRLLLGSNLISSKGFKYFSTYFSFGNLDNLDISGNLLIQSQSIDQIITILCGNVSKTCKKTLKSLDISSTNIERQNFIRLLDVIETESLESFDISRLNLHQRNKYHEGFDLTAYQALAKSKFGNLKELHMNDLALDEQILVLFENWAFPKLQALYLYKNFIDDQSVRHWITKSNFPSLKTLVLAGTDIQDKGLAFIMSQKFELKVLNIGLTLLSPQGLKHIKAQNTKQLQKLFLKDLSIQTHTLQSFFETHSLENLTDISLTNNKQVSNLFQYFPWQKLRSLRTLILTNSYIGDFQFINQSEVLLPLLENLMLNGTGITSQRISFLLPRLHMVFPSLKYVNLVPQFNEPLNFTELSSYSVQKTLKVDLGYASFITKIKGISLLQIKSISCLVLYSSKYDLASYIQPIKQQISFKLSRNFKQKPIPEDLREKIIEELNVLFSIEKLVSLTISDLIQWSIITKWIATSNISVLYELNALYIKTSIIITDLSEFLMKLRLPMVRNLHINVNITNRTENFTLLLRALSNFPNIIDLKMSFTYPSSFFRKKNYNEFLNKLHFPFLTQLDLSGNHLQTEQVGGLLYNHGQTIRFLIISNNFFQKSFLKMIPNYEMRLITIDISSISFSQSEFSDLGKADLRFLSDFKAQSCGLTDYHIALFIESNNSMKKQLFPRLGLLSLVDNDIRQKGMRLLLQQSLYNLISIRISRNYNPHFLNYLLTYTSKITQLLADVEMYALHSNIRPESTRRIRYMAIQTYSFSSKDYEIIGSLNFRRLKIIQVETRHLYSCEDLSQLLYISKYANYIWISLIGDQKRLTSTCIDLKSLQYKDFQTQSDEIVVHQSTDKSFIPSFVELLLNSKRNLRQIVLERLRLPPSLFMLINPKRLEHLKTLYIGHNYIDDEGFAHILQSPLQNLHILRIADTDITVKSLRLLENRTFSVLEHLDLAGLPLGDKGVEVLTKIDAKRLKILVLERCEIKSLEKFNQMQFPLVYQLFISYNDFDVQEIIDFFSHLDRKNWASLWKVEANGYSPTIAQQDAIASLTNNLKIEFSFDTASYMQLSNSAHY